MGILLPCDLSTWPSVVSYLNVLTSGLDSIQDVIVVLLQIHDLCNISIFNDEDEARNHDENMFDHLYQVIEHQFSPEDKERFLKKTLPCLARYAIALPDLKPPKFEYILASKATKFNLDRKFVASLAANAFVSSLCKKSKRLWPHGLPDITFATLFPLLSTDFCSALRFKGFLEYFDILHEEGGPCGRISYELKINPIKKEIKEQPDVVPPRKTLAPVFIVEEDIRPLDLSANVDRLIVKEMASISDMNLQHPELIPLLISTEPKLKENEWIEVRGLMSRVSTPPIGKSEVSNVQNDDTACICIVERTNTLASDDLKLAQDSCFSILQRCFQTSAEETDPSNSSREKHSKTAAMSSKLPSCNVEPEEDSEITDDDESDISQYQHRPKRQCFADRLKNALERGDTPETPEENSSLEPNSGNGKPLQDDPSMNIISPRKRCLSDEGNGNRQISDNNFETSPFDEESSSFSDDSIYSFESLIASYEMEAGYEEMQLDLMKPLHQDEQWKLRCLAITDHLKRMCLSEAYLDICLHLDKCTASLMKPDLALNIPKRHTKSDNGCSYWPQKLKRKQSKPTENMETNIMNSRLPVWIVNHSNEVDSKRFLIEWLSASVQDVPLVVYQSSKGGSMCTDVIAAICSWIEEQSWTTEELYCSLLQGSVGSKMGQ